MLFALLLIFNCVEIISTEKKIQQKAGFSCPANHAGEDTKVLNFRMHCRNTISLFS